jgi:hypothetical protein
MALATALPPTLGKIRHGHSQIVLLKKRATRRRKQRAAQVAGRKVSKNPAVLVHSQALVIKKKAVDQFRPRLHKMANVSDKIIFGRRDALIVNVFFGAN